MEVRYTPEIEKNSLRLSLPQSRSDGIPLNTKSVADLRKLPHWSSDWSLVIPLGRDTVRVEQRTGSAVPTLPVD